MRSWHVVRGAGSGGASNTDSGREQERGDASGDGLSRQEEGEEGADRGVNEAEEEASESHPQAGLTAAAASTPLKGVEPPEALVRCEGDAATDGNSGNRRDEGEAHATAVADSENEGVSKSEAVAVPTPSVSVGGDWREFRARLVQQGLQVADPSDAADQLEAAAAQCRAGGAPADSEGDGEGEGEGEGEWEGRQGATQAGSLCDERGSESELLVTAAAAAAAAAGARSWAHPLFLPETGCLLLAHPQAFLHSQQYFHRAVIFLLTHG